MKKRYLSQQNQEETDEFHNLETQNLKKSKKYIHWSKTSSTNVLVELDGYLQKNDNRSMSIVFYKIQLKMDHGPQHKSRYSEYDKRERGR